MKQGTGNNYSQAGCLPRFGPREILGPVDNFICSSIAFTVLQFFDLVVECLDIIYIIVDFKIKLDIFNLLNKQIKK